MNTIAIVLCVYKNDTVEQFGEMFESLEHQTMKQFDVFVQQDGKIDQTLEDYLDEKHQEKAIHYLGKRNTNRGFAYSLNEIIRYIINYKQYQYIMRMDSDDICIEKRIEKQYDFLEKYPEIDVCGGWIEEFNTDDKSVQIIQYPKENTAIIQHLKKRNPIAHVTTFFRITFFEKVGLYDENKLNEDFDLWVRALEKKVQFYNLQEVLVKVRTNNAFFARRKNMQRAIEVMQLKFKSTKIFSFGITGYFYAIAHFMLFMSPAWLKSLVYKNLRK
jgi:glycosyltransferase involved in cell wall biosynthesis